MRRLTLPAFPVLMASLVVAGCDLAPAGVDLDSRPDAGSLAAEATQAAKGPGDLLQAVKAATARFNSTVQANRAGYEADDHCVAHPVLGGMGMHWVNGALIDPVFDPLKPEVMLYEPGAGNQPRLVAVEYIVIDVGQPHPEFDGHPFDVGGVPPLEAAGVAHWSLHVWAHKDNPAGVFAPFNPDVSCD